MPRSIAGFGFFCASPGVNRAQPELGLTSLQVQWTQPAVNIERRARAVQPSVAAPAKPRVLHILASLSLGGVETWVMHMLRNHDLFSVRHEILLTREAPGVYEEEARRLGITIHKLPIVSSKRAWLRSFEEFLRANGPFAAVHSHLYFFSAPISAAAKRAGVPLRIAHCHAARSRGDDHRTLRHKVRRAIAILWLRRVATRRIGISDAAIEEIAGEKWRDDPKNSVLLYGFDFSRYRGAAERSASLRHKLGIHKDAPIIGHVGRFDPVKNHSLLVDAFAVVVRDLPDAQLVLVGDGPTKEEMAAKATALGIAERVHFAGTTDDVPAYMRMFDLFVLPSFSEGLGIVVVEAQAAGTRAIVSDAVAEEAAIIPGAVEFLPVSAGADAWARAISEAVRPRQPHADSWLGEVERSRFAIGRCVDELDGLYRSELAPIAATLPPVIVVAMQPRVGADGGTTSLGEVITRFQRHRPIIVADRETERVKQWRDSGIETHIVHQTASKGAISSPIDAIRSYWRYARELLRIIKSSGAKVIHANDPAALQLALIPAKLSGTRLVFNLRGTFDPDRPSSRMKYRLLFAAADHVLYLSHEMARVWADHVPNAASSFSVTYSVVDSAKFRPTPMPPGSPPVVLISALLRPLKGQREFIRNVVPKLAAEGIEVWFAGDFDPVRNAYVAECMEAAAPFADSVRFLGYRADIPELMAKSTVIAVPSRHEGMVRAMIEGMSCARPIVSFDVCSAREILEQESGGAGVVVEGGDYAGMADAIIRYCRDRDLASGAGENGFAAAKRLFGASEVVDRYEQAYDSTFDPIMARDSLSPS